MRARVVGRSRDTGMGNRSLTRTEAARPAWTDLLRCVSLAPSGLHCCTPIRPADPIQRFPRLAAHAPDRSRFLPLYRAALPQTEGKTESGKTSRFGIAIRPLARPGNDRGFTNL